MLDYTEDFLEFWKAWPGRWRKEEDRVIKVGKWEAFEEWRRLKADDKAIILKLVVSGRVKRAGTAILPDACRWLKKRRWHDFL